MKKRLAILSSHPIQYNAPMFALLSKSMKLEIKVFYTWSQSKESLFDKDFGQEIQWDIPLLSGYAFEFIENVSKTPGPGNYHGIICPGLNQKIEDWKADAILVYGWNYKAHLSAMRYFKKKIPVYFRGDSTLLDETTGLKALIRRLALRWVYSHIDGAFYVGKNNKAYFLKHGLRTDQLFFAPHAIDNERFGTISSDEPTEGWKSKFGSEEVIFLFVGKFEPKKNPILLLQAFLRSQVTSAHLVMVGNGVLESELKILAGNRANIHFLPFQNQSKMPAMYQMADVLVLPSQGPGETWGLVVNEAMACRKAILASDKVGCAIDLVEPGKNGYIFPSGNIEELEKQIRILASDKNKCVNMGLRSGQIIENWSFSEIVKSLEKNV